MYVHTGKPKDSVDKAIYHTFVRKQKPATILGKMHCDESASLFFSFPSEYVTPILNLLFPYVTGLFFRISDISRNIYRDIHTFRSAIDHHEYSGTWRKL